MARVDWDSTFGVDLTPKKESSYNVSKIGQKAPFVKWKTKRQNVEMWKKEHIWTYRNISVGGHRRDLC